MKIYNYKSYIRTIILIFIFSLIIPNLLGCSDSKETVVIYTSVDQIYSEKIFKAYEQETGVKVKAVYDAEAIKTVGLVNRLIAEKDKPQADVFWNGEIIQTIVLKEEGVLDAVTPENADVLPEGFVDKDNMWFGFGGRARVLIYNKTLISKDDCPKTMEEFAKNPNIDKSAIAYPIFGTTATHAAVHYAYWGETRASKFYEELASSGIMVLDGNSVVKDYVGQKKAFMGLTDTDDALLEMAKNEDLDILFFDQGENDMGTLVIPNTVAKIKGGPNPQQALKFIEFIISARAEQMLTDDEWIQIPVHEEVEGLEIIESADIKIMQADFNKAFEFLEKSKTDLTGYFIR